MAYESGGQAGDKRKRLSTENPEIVNAYVAGVGGRAPSPDQPGSRNAPVSLSDRPALVTSRDSLNSIAPSLRRYLAMMRSGEYLSMGIDRVSLLQDISDGMERFFNKPIRVISPQYSQMTWFNFLLSLSTYPNQVTELPSEAAGYRRLQLADKVVDLDRQDFALLEAGLTPSRILESVNFPDEELRAMTIVEKTCVELEQYAAEIVREAQAIRETLPELRARLVQSLQQQQQQQQQQSLGPSGDSRLGPSQSGQSSSSKQLPGIQGYQSAAGAPSEVSRQSYQGAQQGYRSEGGSVDYGQSSFGIMSSANQPLNTLVPRSTYRESMPNTSTRMPSQLYGQGGSSAGRLSAGHSPSQSRIISPMAANEAHDYNTRTSQNRVSSINQLMNAPPGLQQEYAPNVPSNLVMQESSEGPMYAQGPPGTRLIPAIQRATHPEPEIQDPEPFRTAIQDRLKQYEKNEEIFPPCDRCRRTSKTCTRLLAACGPCTKKHSKCEWKQVKAEELQKPVEHRIPPSEESPSMTPRDRRSGITKLEQLPSLTPVPTASSIGEGSKSTDSNNEAGRASTGKRRASQEEEEDENPRSARRRRVTEPAPKTPTSPLEAEDKGRATGGDGTEEAAAAEEQPS